MSEFPIRRVDRSSAQSIEQLGTKRKFWFRENDIRLLFKAEERGTGDDWAELVACHLCTLLGLPHVNYELAAECDGGREIPGVVCANMASPPLSLVLGNELLLAMEPEYPNKQRRKVRQYTVDAVCDVVSALDLPSDEWLPEIPSWVESALDVFVGYVMLDAWIANQDRHHENWGAIWDGDAMRLAPTFDHGASLARNLSDEERGERLTTRDKSFTVAAFAKRARSAFFGSPTDPRELGLRDAFLAFADRVPWAKNEWLGRLRAVQADAICGILERVPSKRMSETCRRFTMEVLLTNQKRLLE